MFDGIGTSTANGCNAEICRTHIFGHQETLGFLLQTGRSIWAVLHSGHSIGATDFVGLNVGYAAIAGRAGPGGAHRRRNGGSVIRRRRDQMDLARAA